MQATLEAMSRLTLSEPWQRWWPTCEQFPCRRCAELRCGILSTHSHLIIWIAFTKCCKESGFLMVVKCQEENSELKACLTAYYRDPAFYEECKEEYLKEREEYRKTGVPAKQRQQKVPTSM
ncbi:COX assembly mitochondrial protein homolog isoform X1 [Rhinatrema bivittatum]|uniref:COX assembly mitochondrial protein homolog isoform X1 n=1 Tax=Rhinatrema bivittatum TaxID=194408 RepID=UPI0011272336|nr:COX assembly mitochondrial protein homolog isoform X1 [Rhinatrema bivittatum]XP_029445287.1 COX assembly mitochondrial protein homolog isoform X1 [Rhinatrema bivittatum]